MAGNGGIIGPINTVVPNELCESRTNYCSQRLSGCFTTRAGTTSTDAIIISGGGGGGAGGTRGGGGGGAGVYQQSLAHLKILHPQLIQSQWWGRRCRTRMVLVEVVMELVQSDFFSQVHPAAAGAG